MDSRALTPLVEVWAFEVIGDQVETLNDVTEDRSHLGFRAYHDGGHRTVVMTGRPRGGDTSITVRAVVEQPGDLDRAIGHALRRIAMAPSGVTSEEHEYRNGNWLQIEQGSALEP